MLSPDQIRQRVGKLTASRVACLMTGDAEKIMNLWRDLVGDPNFVEEDLSDVWAVQLGACTERLNLDWYEKRTGKPLSRRGDVVLHPSYPWAAATLDGWDDDMAAPVECKHVGGFEPSEKIIERYMPQMQWQMIVTGATKCVFSVIAGAREPVIDVIELDQTYAHELLERACAFMLCVETMTPPVALPAVVAPVKAEIAYDMRENNEWGSFAAVWLANKQAAKDHAAADKSLKALVPPDAIKAFGNGITISRNKAGSLSIKAKD